MNPELMRSETFDFAWAVEDFTGMDGDEALRVAENIQRYNIGVWTRGQLEVWLRRTHGMDIPTVADLIDVALEYSLMDEEA